jgi:methylglutaconyl-CoA hydratase
MLALGAPGALAGAKEILLREHPASMTDDFAEMNSLSATYFAGAEGQEGIRAFGEKRKPSWVTPG